MFVVQIPSPGRWDPKFSLVINFCPSPKKGKRDAFENLCPAFRQIMGGQEAFLVVTFFSVVFRSE